MKSKSFIDHIYNIKKKKMGYPYINHYYELYYKLYKKIY